MSRILFLNQPSVGHLNTLLTIALQMQADGHSVHFLVPGSRIKTAPIALLQTALKIPGLIQKIGLTVDILELKLSPAVLLAALRLPLTFGYAEFAAALDLFAHHLEPMTRGILRFIQSWQPDALVTDFAFPAASIAADAAGLPFITVYHSGLPFRGPGIPPFASGLPIHTAEPAVVARYAQQEAALLAGIDARINRVRRVFGLAETAPGFLCRPYSQWLNLVTSTEAIEAPRDNLGPQTVYIGPCFAGRKPPQSDFPFDRLRPDLYKVYVSLGTVFNNKPEVFRKIMRGLDRPEFQVILSAGGAYPRLSRETHPANALLFPSVPQVDLLPRVDLVIGHGGNNSTNETLAAGKPLLVLPVGGEQGDNASRVEYLRAGLRLDIRHFTPAEVYEKVMAIRANPAYGLRLAELRAEIEKTHGPQTASRLIGQVAQAGQPYPDSLLYFRHPDPRPELPDDH